MGDINDSASLKRIVVITVRMTCFDAILKAVNTLEVKQELSRRGYTHLVIQMGRGTYVPTKSLGEDGSLAVDYFTLSSSIADHLRSVSLVISHADLMDNHQSELAEELAERKHLYCTCPQAFLQVIAGLDLESFRPHHPGDAKPVAKLVNWFFGFPDD